MGNISTNTVFHFTSWTNLLGILKNNFLPKYSTETVHLFGAASVEIAIPMISFCDIPLSQIKEHVQDYGSYGIGMTKSWAFKNGLNPVIYLKKNSVLSNQFKNIFSSKEFNKEVSKTLERCIPSPQEVTLDTGINMLPPILLSFFSLINSLCYVKEYEGFSTKSKRKKVFYNEREWRYVPYSQETMGYLLQPKPALDTQEKIMEANSKIKNAKLNFIPTDINYVIVKKDTETLEMIKELEKIKGSKYSADTIKRLTSRIITYEQIKNDF